MRIRLLRNAVLTAGGVIAALAHVAIMSIAITQDQGQNDILNQEPIDVYNHGGPRLEHHQ